MSPTLWPYPPTEPRDQEHDMTDYRKAAQSLLDGELTDHGDLDTLTSAGVHALLAIHDAIAAEPDLDAVAFEENVVALLTEIREAMLSSDADKIARYQVDRLDGIYAVLDERLGKPRETRIEVHHPTYQPEPSDWRIPRYDELTCECGRAMPCRHCEDDDSRLSESSVNSSEGSVNEGECSVDTAPDVDPDEALRFIHPDAYDRERKWHGEQRVRAEKAEADVERLTRERDEARERTLEMQRLHDRQWTERVKWKRRYDAAMRDREPEP